MPLLVYIFLIEWLVPHLVQQQIFRFVIVSGKSARFCDVLICFVNSSNYIFNCNKMSSIIASGKSARFCDALNLLNPDLYCCCNSSHISVLDSMYSFVEVLRSELILNLVILYTVSLYKYINVFWIVS